MLAEVDEAVAYIKAQGIDAPEVGIVLGTGLGNLVTEIEVEVEVAYTEIPHFPLATVEFHSGKLIYGTLGNKKVLVMQGRFHFYEGYTMQQITFPIRVMKLMGIQALLLSNAAGAMNLDYKKGSLMLITDHINILPTNPLIGANEETFGTRFPDMSEAYATSINEKFKNVAQEKDITLYEGVYVSVMGPCLETPAEYRYLRRIGADAVGMSTVPEVIVANHMGLPCAAVSVLTDECDPDHLEPINIEEIIAIAGKAELKLTQLFVGLIKEL